MPQSSLTIALEHVWVDLSIHGAIESLPYQPGHRSIILWAPDSLIPEVTTLVGEPRFAREIIAKDIEDKGIFAEPVQVIIHQIKEMSGCFQALYSTVSLSQWSTLANFLEGPDEVVPTYNVNGLLFRRCTEKTAVLIRRADRIYLLFSQSGAYTLRSTPAGIDEDPFLIHNLIYGAAEAAGALPYSQLEVYDLRPPAGEDPVADLEVASAIEAPLQVRQWQRQGAGSAKRFRALIEVVEEATLADLCNPSSTLLQIMMRQYWHHLGRAHVVLCVLGLVAAGLLWYEGYAIHQDVADRREQQAVLSEQVNRMRQATKATQESLRQSEFLAALMAAGGIGQPPLARWLSHVREATPQGLIVLGLTLEAPDKEGKTNATKSRGLRLDATFAEGVLDKSSVLAAFVRAVEQRGFSVQSRKSPSAAPSSDLPISEVVTYLLIPQSEALP